MKLPKSLESIVADMESTKLGVNVHYIENTGASGTEERMVVNSEGQQSP